MTPVEFCDFLPAVQKALSSMGKEQSTGEIEDAFKVIFNYQPNRGEDLFEWLERIPTIPEDAAERLLDFDFCSLKEEFGEILEEIELEETLDIDIPDVYPLFQEQEVRHNGEKWTIHRYDADPFPHKVHAHSYERRAKLDLRNGDMYKKKKYCGTMKLKDLMAIRSKVTHPDLPDLDECLKDKSK